MNKSDKQRALVPRLRFPEFRNTTAWTQKPLGKFGRFIRGLTYSASDVADEGLLVLRSSNIQNGTLVLDSDLVFVSKDCPPDLFLREGDIAICMSNGSKPLVGKNAEFKGNFDDPLTIGAFCSVFRPSNEFAKYLLQTTRYHRFVADAIGGGNISNLKNSDLETLNFFVPLEDTEQQKIADFLGSLDGLIAAEGRKLVALRQHKKGLMQQLFPREGETRPHIRFPEFRDAPEWEPQSIGQICQILNNRRVPITSSDRVPGPYPYFGASGIVDYVDDYIFDERLVLVGEDGAKWKAFEPTAFIADGRYWVNNHAHVLKPIGLIDTLLANYLTLLDIGGYVTGAAPPKLTLRKLKTIPIPVPPTDDEQQRIADCLASLDAIIAAQAAKLDALGTHKRGLMQQLFPAPEDAAA